MRMPTIVKLIKPSYSKVSTVLANRIITPSHPSKHTEIFERLTLKSTKGGAGRRPTIIPPQFFRNVVSRVYSNGDAESDTQQSQRGNQDRVQIWLDTIPWVEVWTHAGGRIERWCPSQHCDLSRSKTRESHYLSVKSRKCSKSMF